MKHLKLFFALFAMLALGVGNAWGAALGSGYSKVTDISTLSAGDKVVIYCDDASVGVTGFDTSTKKDATVAATGWVEYLVESATGGVLLKDGSNYISLTTKNTFTYAEQGSVCKVNNSGVLYCTLSNVDYFLYKNDKYYRMYTDKSSNTSYKPFYVYKVVVGGETPGEGGGEEPEEPETPVDPGTGGDALSYTWDLSTNSYSAASNTQVTWPATDVNMVVDKGTASTAPNNYLGGDANNRTSSRFYKNSILTITPEANVTITSVVFAATSDDYASALGSSTWTNATAKASSKTVTVTPTDGTTAISATIGGTCGFTGVTVNYTKAASDEPEPVIVKTLKSIEVTGMTTTFEQGDVFKFDGTCTATYSVTKDGAAQDDETAEVTPTSVSAPDMNQIGTQTITVTYETVSTTYDITIKENEVTPGTYDVLLNNVLWNVSAGQQAASVESMTGKANDITFYTTKGSSQMYASASQTRFYNGATFVISVPTGYVIKSINFTEPTSDKKWEGSISASVGTYDDGTKSWSGNTQEVIFSFAAQNRIANASITFEAIDLTLPSAPTFNPEAGTYNAIQNVTISAEAGTTIYYTLDGTDPTTESDVYASAIEIAETKTLKAIAVKDEKVSPIASAKYTINLPLTTMDQIFAKATAVGSTATPVEITFGNWVVSAVKEDGKTAFVTDGIKGFVIYEAGCGFNVGDVLSGTAACKVLLYNGFAELTGLTSSTTGLSVTTGGTITTQELDATAIEALTGVNTGSLIKINGICSSSDSKYYVAGVQIYTSLYDFGTLKVGAEYNITGIYQPYNTTKEMLPRSAEDIEEVVGLPTATITIADITMEVGKTKTIEATITPDAAQSTVQYAITAGNEYITLNGTTITAVAAGTATITATIAEVAGEYYGATKTFNVTVKPQDIAVLPFTFTGGKTDIENTLGMSQTGLGNDYSGTTNLRFDNTNDLVVIHFDSEPGQLSYEIKGNGFSGGTFSVQQSADGSTYTEVVTYTELGNAATKEHELAAESRYVKFIYTEKSSGNVGLGNITISKPDNRQEAGLAWNPETVTLTVGDVFTAPTLSNPHTVSGITYESSNEAVATVSAEGVIALVDDATGSATITATFAGDKDYKPATATCTIMVNEDCEGSDDFETATATNASSYNTRTTEAGWEATNAAKITIEGELGTYLAINGKTSAVGTITSPELNGGIGSIKIRYANTYSEDNGVSFRLDIKQNDEVVKTYTITKANDDVVKGTVYTELIENINVAGDFQMVFTNLSPSESTSNQDRVSIGRLCWTGYEETPQEPKEETIEPYDFAWEISDGSLIMSADWNETPVYVEIYNAGETLASGTYNAFLNLGGWADASIDKADASVELFVWANGAGADMTGTFVGETTGTVYNLRLEGMLPSGGGEATEYNIEESNVQGVIDPDGNLLLQGETATIMLSAFDPTITGPTDYEATVMYNDYSAYAEGFVTAVTDGTNVEVYGEGLEGEDMTGSAIINAHFVGTILQDGAAVDVEVSDLVVTSDEDLQIAMLSGTGQHPTLGNLTFELYLSNYRGDNVEYQLTSESLVYYPYRSMSKSADITGSLTKSYSSELNTDVYAGTVTTTIDEQVYEINLTMYYIEPEAVDMTVTNATITLEEGTLFIEGEWNSYPFIILDGLAEWSEDKQYQNINIEVGVWGENYYGMLMQDPTKELTITIENNTLTFKGYFIKGDNQQLHKVTISGTMPQTVTEITLTEGENNLTNGATGDVTVNRSFIKDNLYTLSLPFALSATQVKAIFGVNTVLYQFAKLAKEGDELVLYFSKPSAIAAGTPYLIIPSLDVNGFVVRGATITTNTNNISFTADKTTVTMKPVLSAAANAKTNGTTEYWLAANKYLYNNTNTLLSLRALFDISTISGMPPRCRVALGENVETSLEDLFTTDAPVKVIENGQLIIIRDGVKYNVQGQKL